MEPAIQGRVQRCKERTPRGILLDMRVLFCLQAFFACCALADEAAERSAIRRVIDALNERPVRAEIFTADSDARPGLIRLEIRSWTPTIEISHEPWGEATIYFPFPQPGIESLNPRFVSTTIRFITPDVALVDGTWQTVPLLFVMKKEENDWKIASLRTLAPH